MTTITVDYKLGYGTEANLTREAILTIGESSHGNGRPVHLIAGSHPYWLGAIHNGRFVPRNRLSEQAKRIITAAWRANII